MSTNTSKTSWLVGLLSGWGIRESWAKIIAGALIGALSAAGFLSSCSEPHHAVADAALLTAPARVSQPL